MVKKVYDIFLSHDFEDKSAIADALNIKLREAGFTVWYSGTDLTAGDNLEDLIINQIIPNSRYTVAIISPNYVKSRWTKKEFNAAASLETKNKRIIIPVLFNIPFSKAAIVFPIQLVRFAITAGDDLDKTLRQLVRACKPDRPRPKAKRASPKKPGMNISEAGVIALQGNVSISGHHAAGRDIMVKQEPKK